MVPGRAAELIEASGHTIMTTEGMSAQVSHETGAAIILKTR